MYLSELQVKNATAVGALIQVINWPDFAVEYLLDLSQYTEDGKDVPRHESDLKVHNFVDPRGRQKLGEQCFFFFFRSKLKFTCHPNDSAEATAQLKPQKQVEPNIY